jgi:cell division protein FtsL
MKKIQKALAIATIVSAVGVSYALYTLRGLPDTFDWEDEEDEY